MSDVIVPQWTLTDRMRKAREHAGLTQAQIGAELGVSASAVTAYETGRNSPRKATLIVWAMVCGVPYEWLVEGGRDLGGEGTRGYLYDERADLGMPYAPVIAIRRRAAATSTGAAIERAA